ncbi:Midasin, partial [Bienertia sinuspersici]
MAYFYTSNYPQIPDNYHYYNQYNNNDYYYSDNQDYSRYVQYYDTQFHGNAYQHAPNPSLVGYYYSNYYQPETHFASKNAYFHENGSDYYYSDPVLTTEYTVYYNTVNGEAKDKDLVFEGYDPKPFHGVEDDDDDDDDVDDHGDDGGEKKDEMGKEPFMGAPIASNLDDGKKEKQDEVEKKDDYDKDSSKNNQVLSLDDGKDKNQNVGEVNQEEKSSKIEEEAKKQQEQEGITLLNDEGKKEEINGSQIKRQIPPGYGMEALDLCEGLFGGYFPCLWKKNQRNNNNNNYSNNQESGNSYEKMSDYDYCCKDTVDYLFGNPNPYGGTMPEKGSYGDPVYSYQRCRVQGIVMVIM